MLVWEHEGRRYEYPEMPDAEADAILARQEQFLRNARVKFGRTGLPRPWSWEAPIKTTRRA